MSICSQRSRFRRWPAAMLEASVEASSARGGYSSVVSELLDPPRTRRIVAGSLSSCPERPSPSSCHAIQTRPHGCRDAVSRRRHLRPFAARPRYRRPIRSERYPIRPFRWFARVDRSCERPISTACSTKLRYPLRRTPRGCFHQTVPRLHCRSLRHGKRGDDRGAVRDQDRRSLRTVPFDRSRLHLDQRNPCLLPTAKCRRSVSFASPTVSRGRNSIQTAGRRRSRNRQTRSKGRSVPELSVRLPRQRDCHEPPLGRNCFDDRSPRCRDLQSGLAMLRWRSRRSLPAGTGSGAIAGRTSPPCGAPVSWG